MKPKHFFPSHAAGFATTLVTSFITLSFSSAAFAADNFWQGTTTDWNTPANWSLGGLPTNPDDAIVNTLTNFPVIVADIAATPRDITVGRGATGQVDHRSGVAAAGGGWMYVGTQGGNGTYNLADTSVSGGGLTGFGQGSGTVNVNGRLYIGGFGGGTGIMRVNTSGSVNIATQLQVGEFNDGNGTLIIENGAVNANNEWCEIGNRATGTLSMSGGSFTKSGNDYFVFGSNTGTGFGTATGGTITTNADMWLGTGAGSTGTFTLSGTAFLNVGGWSIIGRDGGNMGTFNFGGGTFHTNGTLIAGDNTKGTLNQTGGAGTVAGELWVGQGSSPDGNYNLSGGTMTVDSWTAIGRSGGKGTMTISGGAFNKTAAGGGNFIVGDTSQGLLTQTGGAIDIKGEMWVGQGSNTGTYNISAGTLAVDNWLAIARNGGTGFLNMAGGTITKTGGGSVTVGTGDGTHGGAISISNGLLDIQSGVLFLCENGNDGTNSLTLSGTGQINTAELDVAYGDAGCTGNANLNGGTLRTARIVGGAGTANVVFGTTQVIATADAGAFISDLDLARIDGTLTIDSNGKALTTAQAFSGTGGLVKTGAGTLTLSGSSAYTGDTNITSGTLSLLTNTALNDNSSLWIVSATGLLNLGFIVDEETVKRFYIDGVSQAAGRWGRVGSIGELGADHESALISGDGLLMVTEQVTGTPYDSFLSAHGLPGAAMSADNDNDGYNNLAEFILGGEPNPANAGSNTNHLSPSVTTGANTHLFAFRRDSEALNQPGLTITYEYSSDLVNWTAATAGMISTDTGFYGGTIDKVTVTIPDPVGGKVFVRMHASMP